MSQERTRFPIQPDDRRRTARSSRDIKAVPDEPAAPDEAPPDKPPVPPHERDRPRGGDGGGGRDEDQPEAGQDQRRGPGEDQ